MITDEIFGYHIFLDKSKWGKGLTDEFGYSRFGDQFWDRFESPYFSNRFGLTNIFLYHEPQEIAENRLSQCTKKPFPGGPDLSEGVLTRPQSFGRAPSDANGAQ